MTMHELFSPFARRDEAASLNKTLLECHAHVAPGARGEQTLACHRSPSLVLPTNI